MIRVAIAVVEFDSHGASFCTGVDDTVEQVNTIQWVEITDDLLLPECEPASPPELGSVRVL